MSEFKVGDKVRILPHAVIWKGTGRKAGDEFSIFKIEPGFIDARCLASDANNDWYSANEIELVTEAPQVDMERLKADLEQVRQEHPFNWGCRSDQELASEKLFVILERHGLLQEPKPEKTATELLDELRQQVTTRGWTDGAELIDALQKKIAEG